MRKVIVDQIKVKDALHACIKPYTIAKKLNIPITVIKDIQNGKDRPSFFRRPIRDKEKLCTCCGFREKMPNAKYLCYVCFAKHAGASGIDEYQILM